MGVGSARAFEQLAMLGEPLDVLVAAPFLEQVPLATLAAAPWVRRVMLDSGAYTAHNTGKQIDFDWLVDVYREAASVLSGKPLEFVALDVIGDWRASRVNAERMAALDIAAFPTFHKGEPWVELGGLVRDFPKVGLGDGVGMVKTTEQHKRRGRYAYHRDAFARFWPASFHAFGIQNMALLRECPFVSADCALWLTFAARYRFWQAFRNRHGEVRTDPATCEHGSIVEAARLERLARELRGRHAASLRLLVPPPSGV